MGLIVFLGSFTFLVAPDSNFSPNPLSTKQLQEAEPLPDNGPPTVVIDPGHGGKDDGTKWFGLAEKDMTLDVGQRLNSILKSMGVNTLMTRTDDVFVSLPRRAELANNVADENSNAVFVSIHFNQSVAESADGIETYYADKKIPPASDWTWVGFFNHPEDESLDRGANLAADVQSAAVNHMGEINRGIKSGPLFVTRHTRMPAILVEGGFLSNKIENQSLRNDAYRQRLAEGIAAGIVSYLRTANPTVSFRMAAVDTQKVR